MVCELRFMIGFAGDRLGSGVATAVFLGNVIKTGLELRMTRNKWERLDTNVQIAQLIAAIVVGFCGVALAIASCSVANSQLRLEAAEALPEINVQCRRFSYSGEENADTLEMIISNDSGYLCNPKSKVTSFAHIRGYKELDMLIPVAGVWYLHGQTGNTKGVIERIWSPENLRKMEKAFDEVEDRFRDASMYIELETYMAFGYRDLQGIEQTRYYRINQMGSAMVLAYEEYEASVGDDERIISSASWDIDSTSSETIMALLEKTISSKV